MADKSDYVWLAPNDVLHACARRVRALRLAARMPQTELAERVGVAVGTIKRFEHTGEIQFSTLLTIALVLGRLPDFEDLFQLPDVPQSLYRKPEPVPQKRARKKRSS